MTNTLCEAIRHDLHTVDTPVNAPAGAPSEIQPAALGAVQGAETPGLTLTKWRLI